MRLFLFLSFILYSFCASAQSFLLPTGQPIPVTVFTDVAGWWRADSYSGTAGSYVLTDKSSRSNNMGQISGTLTPGTAANGQAKFTATSGFLTSNLSLRSWPCTIITVGKRSSGVQTGFFGHADVNSWPTLWYGYESSNQYSIYAVNRTNNTTAEFGADAVYMARIGYGSRVPFLNGLIQADMTEAGIVRSASMTTSIGTQYRNLNMDWYETLVWDRTLSIAEIDEVNTYLNTRYGMSMPLWSSYTSVNEIGFGGQSNSDGRGDRGTADVNIPVAYRSLLSNVFDWDGAAFPNMDLSSNVVFNTLYIGQELTAAKDYADASTHNLYVYKLAVGSTSMSYRPAGTNNGYWTNIHDATSSGDLASKFSTTMFSFWTSMRVHQIAARKPIMLGYVFYQGEDDATDVTEAGNWNAVATPFFAAIRSEFGLGNVKIFLVRIHAAIDLGQQPYRDTVRAQQDACAASLNNCQEVSVDSYGLRDGAHINVAGQLSLGSFLATQF